MAFCFPKTKSVRIHHEGQSIMDPSSPFPLVMFTEFVSLIISIIAILLLN